MRSAGPDPFPLAAGSAGAPPDSFASLVDELLFLPPISLERSELVDMAVGVWSRPGFDLLVTLPQLRFEPFDYQIRAARVVLQQMGGRAILADEVGLGKTIEAGIVLSELRSRGLARRALVLAPAGLIAQWGEELERKFAMPTVVSSRKDWEPDATGSSAEAEPVVLASLASARREPLRDLLAVPDWDLVIVDEAHRVRNPRSSSSRLVRSLRSRSLLLLTATPVENDLNDLYHLVSLIRPGHLGTLSQFRMHYGGAKQTRSEGASNRALGATPAAQGSDAILELRRRLRDVMIRHRRSEVAQMLPRRLAETRTVEAAEDEGELYRRVADRVRVEGRRAGSGRAMALRTLLRLAGSSARAVAPSLERMGWVDLAQAARAVRGCAKVTTLASLLQQRCSHGEKVIVFTSFRETLDQLDEAAQSLGIPAAIYHGALNRHAKDAAIASFEQDVDVLLSTESAGEGRNLQFCHAMVNFDLPWNPMRIEQRLGRIHRIGQDHEVVLTNLVTRGTIEEHILDVLHTKLNLFELVVGELDMVLGRVREDFVFEDAVFEAHVESENDAELADRLGAIGTALAEARAQYVDSRRQTDELVTVLEGDEVSLSNAGLSNAGLSDAGADH